MGQGAVYLPTSRAEQPRAKRSRWPLAILAGVLTAMVLFSGPDGIELVKSTKSTLSFSSKHNDKVLKGACVQAEPRMPQGYNTSKVLEEKERIIDWLSGAVSE